MWLHRVTTYLLRHRYQALALTLLSAFISIIEVKNSLLVGFLTLSIGMLGILLATLITLCKGPKEGALFTLAATLPYGFSLWHNPTPSTFTLVVWAAIGVAVISNTLTWVFAVMLQRQARWSFILQSAALFGVLVISLVHLVYPGVSDWWGNQLQAYYAHAQSLQTLKKPPMTPEMQLESINSAKQIATGSLIAAILFNGLSRLLIARWWQAAVFSPRSLGRELKGIRLSPLAGLLFVLSLVLYYLGNAVVLDIMPILYLLFGAAGLSLIHYIFGLMRSSTTWFWLAILYMTLIFSFPNSLIVVSVLALFDSWFDIRKRLTKV